MFGPMKLAIVCFSILGFAQVALASPELPITSPWLNGGLDGPINDPSMSQGQSFYNYDTQSVFPLPIQFHDNPVGAGGTGGTDVILGIVNSVTTVGGNITAFTIQASITYDLPAVTPFPQGTNSHAGSIVQPTPELNIQSPPTLTANFAISSLTNMPASFTGPYVQQSPQIIAVNNNLLAWYCWTPGLGGGEVTGGYYVPGWNHFYFNGFAWEETLDFTVDGAGLAPTDPRFSNIENSYLNQLDIFTSQSSQLQISSWESSLNLDPGDLYPTGQDLSDVSVFVPEPATLTLLGIGTLSLLACAGWRNN
jgi:PEP-CTERM motif